MISRIWHGYTRPGDADAYEALLRDEIITGIENRSIDGFREISANRADGQGMDDIWLIRRAGRDADH